MLRFLVAFVAVASLLSVMRGAQASSASASSECSYTSIDTSGLPDNISLALYSAAGLINNARNGPVLYLPRSSYDHFWARTIIDPFLCPTATPKQKRVGNPYAYLAELFGSGQLDSIILYAAANSTNGTLEVTPTIPSVITMCGVKRAVPMDRALYLYLTTGPYAADMKNAAVVLDTEALWHNDPYVATNYTIHHALHETDGFSTQDMQQLRYGGLADLIIARRQFATYLPNACVGGSPANDLLKQLVTMAPTNGTRWGTGWKPPVSVSGYNAQDFFLGGFLYEASTDCNAIGPALGMGTMASQHTRNLAFLAQHRRFNLSAPRGSEFGPLRQTQETPGIRYNASKIYLAPIYGDNDNLDFVSTFTSDHVREWAQLFQTTKRKFALSWTMSPHLWDVAPQMLRWYFQQAAAVGGQYAEILLPPSGMNYMYPAWFSSEIQQRVVNLQNQIAEIYDAASSILWEWFFVYETPKGEIKDYMPRYIANSSTAKAKRRTRNFFTAEVPWPLMMIAPPAYPDFDMIIGDPSKPDENVVAVRSSIQWQAGPQSGGGGFKLTPQEAAQWIEKLPAGSLSYLYYIQNGPPHYLFSAVNNITAENVELVKVADLGELARQKAMLNAKSKKKQTFRKH
jgi:hypothetical protein